MKFKLALLLILFSLKSAFSQSIQLSGVPPSVFCSSGQDTFRFSLNYSNIPANSNIVFYQSTNPAFNPYAGQGDSIGFINIAGNTSGGGQITTACPEILGIFIDACDQGGTLREVDNEYMVITSGNAGFNVSDLKIQLPNTSINITGCPFSTPSAATMTTLRNGTCDGTTLIAAGQSDFIPANAIVLIFTGRGTVYNYNFSSYCSSGQPIYILQNSCSPGTANFVNNAPNSCPSNGYRATTITAGSCTDKLTYFACTLPPFDAGNPNANDGNYVIHLPNTDTSSITNGGIRNNAADRCNGLRFDSLAGSTIIKYPIPNDGGANPATNFCNTGLHYIKAITNPGASQPISNAVQFELICLDLSTNVNRLSICSGTNANVSISSTDPSATFSWTLSGGAGITGAGSGNGNSINQTLNYSGSTSDSLTYNITATHGICTKNASVKVVVNNCTTCNPFNLGADTAYCLPFSRTLSTGNPNTVWSTGVTAASITVSALGTYYATCAAFSDTIRLTQASSVSFDFGANTTSVCNGGNISLDASTAYDSYLWNTGAVTNSITITTPGKYWVDVFKNGCKGTDTIDVIQIEKEPKPNLGPDISVCSPVSQTLSTGKTNTSWYLNNITNQVGTGANFNATQFGTYIAKVSNSCGDVFDTIIITQTTSQQPINLGNDTTYCGTFSRVLSTGNAATVWSTGVTAASITVTTPGTYTATINVGCGIATDAITLSQSSGVSFDFGSNTTSVCVGSGISIGAGNAFDSYLWSTGATSNTITITQPGIYWIDVFKNGCKASDTISVIQISKEPKPSIGRDTSYCSSFSQTLSTGNATTEWFRNAVLVSTAASLQVIQAGTYVARISNSCGAVSDTIVISTGANLNVNIGRDTTICSAASITLNAFTAGSGISYTWNTGAITPSIAVSQFGIYFVEVSNGLCTTTDTISIDVISKPTIASLGNDTSFCGNFSYSIFTGDANTSWSTGTIGPQINVTQPGRIIAENRNQCGSAADTIFIQQFALPFLDLGKDSTICDSIVLSVGNGSFLSIRWNTNDSSSSIVVNNAGTYAVTVSNVNCSNSDSVIIKKECFYEVYIPTAFSPNGDNFNDVFVPLSDIKGIQVISFLIFNRWGEKVYEAENFTPNDATKGWNGTYKGENCLVDHYVYYYSVKLPDDKIKIYKGAFALLR